MQYDGTKPKTSPDISLMRFSGNFTGNYQAAVLYNRFVNYAFEIIVTFPGVNETTFLVIGGRPHPIFSPQMLTNA